MQNKLTFLFDGGCPFCLRETTFLKKKDVLNKIKSCKNGTWEHMVPNGVAEIIKSKSLFGTSCKIN